MELPSPTLLGITEGKRSKGGLRNIEQVTGQPGTSQFSYRSSAPVVSEQFTLPRRRAVSVQDMPLTIQVVTLMPDAHWDKGMRLFGEYPGYQSKDVV